MKRKLFCEISPLTYAISLEKQRFSRRVKTVLSGESLAAAKGDKLPATVYSHSSLIRRRLGNVDMQLQENKHHNLSLAAPKVDGVLIKPGQVFSFWNLVGNCTKGKGYKEGLTLSRGKPSRGYGGGMCQFTNLLHWLVLHSPMDIVEHHHHDGVDLFPDFGRQIPFGCGTSIMYNFLDYRFKNNTCNTFQICVQVTETHLCGQLRAYQPLRLSYHIVEENGHFVRQGESYRRRNKIMRKTIDKSTGSLIKLETVKESDALVMYDEVYIDKALMRE